jgi:hypothetical protein
MFDVKLNFCNILRRYYLTFCDSNHVVLDGFSTTKFFDSIKQVEFYNNEHGYSCNYDKVQL